MTDTRTIRPAADDHDVAHAADLITRSFDHLAANRYLVPADEHRLPILRAYFHLLTEHAARGAGEVLLTDGAVLVWFDRTTETAPPEHYEHRLAELAGDHLPRFQEIEKLLDYHHPNEPHWHLAFLAVEPDQWGHGLGNQLMNHAVARLDEQDTACYLEAASPDNHRLYRRHGFTDMTPSVLQVADGTPVFHRMWRPARPR